MLSAVDNVVILADTACVRREASRRVPARQTLWRRPLLLAACLGSVLASVLPAQAQPAPPSHGTSGTGSSKTVVTPSAVQSASASASASAFSSASVSVSVSPSASSPAPAAVTVDRITWLTSDNSTASNPGVNGVTDRIVSYLAVWWPGVKHEVLIANTKRSWQMLEDGQQVCRANVVRTPEREKLVYFTNTQLSPPPQLVVRRDRLSRLPRNAAGEVLLPQLLADDSLRGALVDGRSYGTAIDEMLARRPAHSNVSLYSPRDFGGRLLQMISLDRADYSIDSDIALLMMGEPKDLMTVPIRGASELVMAGIACPRTPWGWSAIKGIDRALGRPEGAATLRRGLMRWITPETRAHYASQLDQFYRERAKPSRLVP